MSLALLFPAMILMPAPPGGPGPATHEGAFVFVGAVQTAVDSSLLGSAVGGLMLSTTGADTLLSTTTATVQLSTTGADVHLSTTGA